MRLLGSRPGGPHVAGPGAKRGQVAALEQRQMLATEATSALIPSKKKKFTLGPPTEAFWNLKIVALIYHKEEIDGKAQGNGKEHSSSQKFFFSFLHALT
jgi:hypothetical protein